MHTHDPSLGFIPAQLTQIPVALGAAFQSLKCRVSITWSSWNAEKVTAILYRESYLSCPAGRPSLAVHEYFEAERKARPRKGEIGQEKIGECGVLPANITFASNSIRGLLAWQAQTPSCATTAPYMLGLCEYEGSQILGGCVSPRQA